MSETPAYVRFLPPAESFLMGYGASVYFRSDGRYSVGHHALRRIQGIYRPEQLMALAESLGWVPQTEDNPR